MDELFPYADQAAGPRLRAIADELVRLAPSRTDPHRYHEVKSGLVHELRCLALGLDQVMPRVSTPEFRSWVPLPALNRHSPDSGRLAVQDRPFWGVSTTVNRASRPQQSVKSSRPAAARR
jgi:hypothetical protein